MQVHYFYGVKTHVIAVRGVVVTVAAATAVVGVAFEVVVGITRTCTLLLLLPLTSPM